MNFNFKMKLSDEERYMTWPEIALDYTRIFIAEFIGTFLLIFFGCACSQSFKNYVEKGSNEEKMLKDTVWHAMIPVGEAMCFGLVVGSIIQIFWVISLSHINPAVSLSFFIFGINSLAKMFLYIIAQLAGSTAGIVFLKQMLVFEDNIRSGSIEWKVIKVTHRTFCCTEVKESLTLTRAFFWEFTLTSFLILSVCNVIDSRNVNKNGWPLKFGFLVFCLIFIGATLTGASMNPARSFAPALISGSFDHHWIYWVAPLSASFVTSILYHILFLPNNGQDNLRELMKIKKDFNGLEN